jgi:hypothetical protein
MDLEDLFGIILFNAKPDQGSESIRRAQMRKEFAAELHWNAETIKPNLAGVAWAEES